MIRFARYSAGELRFTLTDDDDTVLTPAAPPTVTIVDDAGVAVTGSPFATSEIEPDGTAAPAPNTTGLYRCAIPATLTATLGIYHATFNATVSGAPVKLTADLEVNSCYIFTVADLRAYDTQLADASKYTARRIRLARDAAHDRIEELCNASFVTRRTTVTLDGDGKPDILIPNVLPSALIAATVITSHGSAPVALTAPELADVALYDLGLLRRQAGSWPAGNRNVTLTYEHGLTQPPIPCARAAMILAREALTQSAVPSRAMSESTELGVLRYAIAGRDGWTGFPDVDSIIDQYGRNGITLGAAGRPR